VKVLVTGASGLLGAGVARALAERGDRVTVLQRRPAGLGLREVRGDVADPAVVDAAAAGQDAVVHLAAKVNVVGAWPDYQRINVGGTATVIAACRRLGVPRLVHVSSPSVAHAGTALIGAPAGPADPAGARGPYARSKAMAELLALAADGPDLAVLAIRPHLVWGPGDTQLVARIVGRARSGRLPVIGSGAALVDTVYVDNAVDALVVALDRCAEVRGEALVVTNGEPRPIAELLGAIAEAGGAPRPTRHVPIGAALAGGSLVEMLWRLRARFTAYAGEDDPPITRFLAEQLSTAHWFDQRRTRVLLGWAPRVSLDEGLDRLRRSYLAG
jgi:nucleoside-diphosphate-sugar epimerase